jgi:hypothetical protein
MVRTALQLGAFADVFLEFGGPDHIGERYRPTSQPLRRSYRLTSIPLNSCVSTSS